MSDAPHYDIIRPPVSSGKTSRAAGHNQVVFRGAPDATRPEIKAAVEALCKARVRAVNTLVRKGKVKRFRGTVGRQSDVKKAIVTLEPGYRIDVTTGL